MPGKRASKETSRTPRECAAGRPEGRKALWAGVGRHRPGAGKRRGMTRSGLASRKPLARASGNFSHSKDALMFGGRERSGIAELKSRFHAKKSSVDTAAINSWNGG